MISYKTFFQHLEKFAYEKVISKHDKKTAKAAANAVIHCLSINFKGRNMYIPTPKNRDTKHRNECIVRDFTGHNHMELSVKYGISFHAVYGILRKARLKNSLKDSDTFSARKKKNAPKRCLLSMNTCLLNWLV